MSEIPLFHGMKKEYLRPCSRVIELPEDRKACVMREGEMPFEKGTIVYDAGTLRDDCAHINAVGVVLDGKAKSTTIMILEVDSNVCLTYKQGDIVTIDAMRLWRDTFIGYKMTDKQTRQRDDYLKQVIVKEALKRKEQREINAAKKKKNAENVPE